jgi:putative transposase
MADDLTPASARRVRHRPAHPPVVESIDHSLIVFLTLCTERRRPSLANAAAHDALLAAWRGAANWRVGRSVPMPDHVHFFCAPGAWPPPPLRP